MALRRRDVILAGVAVFIAWGFVTHWIPSSRYLPWAFSTGVLCTVILIAWLLLTTSRGPGVRAGARNYGPRHAAFARPDAWEAETRALSARSEYLREPIYEPSFLISGNIDGLIDLILRDFVRSWYDRISTRPAFTIEVDRSMREALANIRDRVLAVDLIAVGTSKLVPIITSHMKEFYEAEKIVRGRMLSRNVTESEELDLAIAAKYKDGKLHPAASLAFSNTKLGQQQHLRTIVTRLLPKVLPTNMTTSRAVTVLIQEIVSCAVLFPVMQMLSDADTWNKMMEAYGHTILQDRKTVRKLREALDEHAPPSPQNLRPRQFPRLSPNDNERKFERFIRAIKQCNTLSDARRFRSEIASQLYRDSGVENPDTIYLRRLETAKRILDQKVAQLGVGGAARSKFVKPKSNNPAPRLENASLREVLYSSSGLSYFMEFMDRQNLMRLVQFWIVVDGMRNPLEEDNEEVDESTETLPQWTAAERTDIAQINDAYLTKSELEIASKSRHPVSEFLRAGKDASPLQYHAARRAVLRAQTAVYNEMQDPYFQKFKRTDLWYKWLASDEAGSSVSGPSIHQGDHTQSSHSRNLGRLPRSSSAKHVLQKPTDLRRAAVSSSNLQEHTTPGTEQAARRSLDATPARTPLFDDEYDSDALGQSTQSLESELDPPATGSDANVVNAMQAALNDIMGDDGPEREPLFDKSPVDKDSLRGSFEIQRSNSPLSQGMRPSIASLGLVGAPSRLGVFNQDDLFGSEEAKFREDEVDDSEKKGDNEDDEIHEAAPGDLGLAEAIDSLTQDIEKLVTQESIVDSLTNKAELTNNAAELRILRKSKASLQRELHRKELQRQQYIVQESDNSLYGRATISITSIMVGTEDDGHEYAMYVIEVKRQAGDQMPAAVWAITRRYSEFHDLNKKLKARYPHIRNLEFPRRQVMLKLQKDFLQKRRLALERWLREILLIPAICRSRELRAFLSQHAISSSDQHGSEVDSRDFVSRIYSSVTDGMEEFLGNIPVLDQLSVAGQNLISAATSQLATAPNDTSTSTGLPGAVLNDDPATSTEAEAELRAFENRELEPFVKPIADLFVEIFSLNTNNNWLRGRAVVVVLHQLLGGTIERKVRDMARGLVEEDNVVRYLNMARDTMWPGGKMRPSVPRTEAEKKTSKKEASVLLATLVPDLAANVVGRQNAQQASRRIAATFNNQRLNTHLVFTLLDEIIGIIFDEPSPR
ncbi:hypothetical protein EJ05DRAFT_194509 [Pseudovirgaria hyperparasitica]|uniref:Intermediate filament protein-like protein n=1 Tax=Pseudovirgaria hyperparasitica TaxID=470096 RepID=A0A6A6WK04_9PEZI|nr:uncharacterized protein EJ05DRAFT_194509 [Pseudovirgaria hyperparasitica]KAF2762021.1 hypothetical protein EJ05DRAFT_194509 [Pseudovirgaria hyperparasitica]